VLHITNGDAAVHVVPNAGIAGSLLPWRDVLHDGPVPGGADPRGLREIRARFIADCGWDEYPRVLADFERRDAALEAARKEDELVLWFEHDLYDQLQLIQVLDRVSAWPHPQPPVSLICDREYLGSSAPDRIGRRFEERRGLPPGALAFARTAWAAFTSPDPTAVTALAGDSDGTLPFVAAAFRRALEEYPSRRNGLSRSESQILAALAGGPRAPGDLFRAAHHDVEDPVFLGDAVFAIYARRLACCSEPALLPEDGGPIEPQGREEPPGPFWTRPVRLTDFGRALLDGREDWVATNGLDRWLGGVHLSGRRTRWRWDEEKRALVGP
jgi:hypothetical protein